MNPLKPIIQGAKNVGGLIKQAPGIIKNTVGMMQSNARGEALNKAILQPKKVVQKPLPVMAQAKPSAIGQFTGRMKAIKNLSDSI